MMLPEDMLVQCPFWANFIAQDADGTWWAYEAEPHRHDSGWYENEVGRIRRLDSTVPSPYWQTTLQKPCQQ